VSAHYRPFSTVLVANRGEIAVRVLRGIREAGLRSVAVASEPDRLALHTVTADHCAVLGEGPAADSYLNADKVLAAARDSGADAIHPGYGFFAESAAFARRVQEQGLVWIGPAPDVIEALGDKVSAKEIARRAGVPVCPGYEGDVADTAAVQEAAEEIGFPLLVKAAAGGGGRGMRIVREAGELVDALESAAREAEGAFGSGRVFLEKYVEPARHVEIQIVGDIHGNVLHLGERECSVQRRYQKIIEESPSPVVDAELRARMGDAAVALAQEAGYVGAGTVEFLLGPDGDFYFLEVNTRLQVEHPVTELVTGLDLVHLQLQVAAGEPLPTTEAPEPRGHSIELRVCAEDPAFQFAPQSGRIVYLRLPTRPGVRVDAGIRTGYDIPTHYDSLLLKLISHGATREEARIRALRGLADLIILGPKTNAAYLRAILEHEAFIAGDLSTSFIADHMAGWKPDEQVPPEVLLAAAAGEFLGRRGAPAQAAGRDGAPEPTAWSSLGTWRIVDPAEGRAS
jgi:acetyl/propionyl-CoA carboxylase alpha subunit